MGDRVKKKVPTAEAPTAEALPAEPLPAASRYDRGTVLHAIAVVVLLAGATTSLFLDSGAWLSWLSVGGLLLWMILILVESAQRSSKTSLGFGLPLRTWAIPLPFLFLTVAVLAFANIYAERTANETGIHETRDGAVVPVTDWRNFVYFSVATITTVGYGDLRPVDPGTRMVTVAEVGTGLLILACTFPLLLARISQIDNFEEP